jgi:hypothetical protein
MKTFVRYTSGNYGNTTHAKSYKIKVSSETLSGKLGAVMLEVEYGNPQRGIGA